MLIYRIILLAFSNTFPKSPKPDFIRPPPWKKGSLANGSFIPIVISESVSELFHKFILALTEAFEHVVVHFVHPFDHVIPVILEVVVDGVDVPAA